MNREPEACGSSAMTGGDLSPANAAHSHGITIAQNGYRSQLNLCFFALYAFFFRPSYSGSEVTTLSEMDAQKCSCFEVVCAGICG